MFTSFKRVVALGWVSFWRQGGLTLATCFILVTAILLIVSLISLKSLTDFAISDLQNKVDISVYFTQDAQESDILKVKDELSQVPQVKSVEYVSKDQALANFTQLHQNDQTIIDSLSELGDNPLLASLNIKSWQLDQYQQISDFLSGIQQANLIQKVDYYQRKPLIERVSEIASGVRTAGLAASVVLAIIAVLITYNTIRLAILNQKEEIGIQRLVGASNWFIRGPFLVQGIMAGIISALVAFAIFIGVCWFVNPRMMQLFSDVNLFQLLISNFWVLLGIQIGVGISLGSFSSLLAIRKYLKV